MTATDQLGFTSALRDLALAYRGKRLNEDEVEAYLSGLEQYDLPWLEAGMRRAKSLYPRFFPSVGEIVIACKKAEEENRVQRYVKPETQAAMDNAEVWCRKCEDTGFVSEERMSKFGDVRRYVRFCHCRMANPIYQANRSRLMRPVSNE